MHLTRDDRYTIENNLSNNISLKQIGRNIDLPRKVRFRQRVKQVTVYKIDKNCLENRTYEDF